MGEQPDTNAAMPEVPEMDTSLYRALYPAQMTEPCYHCISRFLLGGILAHDLDVMALAADGGAMSLLARYALGHEFTARADAIALSSQDPPGPRPFRDALAKHQNALSEMILCRAVDTFLTYISRLLTIIFEIRPECLKTTAKVSIEEVLEHDSKEQLIQWLAERRVNELSYGGINDVTKYFSKRLGFELLKPEDLSKVTRIVEDRNLLVHNDGIVNERYSSRTGATMSVGTQLTITPQQAFQDGLSLWTGAVHIDGRAVSKFSLPCPKSWPGPQGEADGSVGD